MTQLTAAFYVELAEYYDSAKGAIVGAAVFMEDALDTVVDITTSTNPADAAEIELALLGPANTSKEVVDSLAASSSSFLTFVRALNSYIINNNLITDATLAAYALTIGAPSVDALTYFVNFTCENTWTTGYCPCYWEDLSSAAGYDTTYWKTLHC